MPSFVVREIQSKTIINRVQGMPFKWSINPYRGCRHACVYCYARPTHEYMGMNGAEEFQEVIFTKVNGPQLARAELGKRSWQGDNVVVGTATDPYQQAESRYRITRGILEAFRDFSNPVSITTKSPMVLRDIEILADLASRAPVTVHFTVTTMDERVWKLVEPTTSKPRKRLEAVRTLNEHGIRAGVFLAPILPGITDDERHLERVISAAAGYGAKFIMPNVLRLGPGISEYYLPFIAREFPDLVGRYRELYPRNYVPGSYAQVIEARVKNIKHKIGFVDEPIPTKTRAHAMPHVPGFPQSPKLRAFQQTLFPVV